MREPPGWPHRAEAEEEEGGWSPIADVYVAAVTDAVPGLLSAVHALCLQRTAQHSVEAAAARERNRVLWAAFPPWRLLSI